MANTSRPRGNQSREASPEDALEALSAGARNRPNSADKIRRALEAQIEAKTRKRRKRETPASAGWKK